MSVALRHVNEHILKKNNIFKVPEVPKGPPKKKPTPIRKSGGSPTQGTLISNKPKAKRLTNWHSTASLIIMTYVGNS